MSSATYTLLDTELGRCGIAWKEPSHPNENLQVIGFQLPEATAQLTETRIAKRSSANKARTIKPQIGEIIKRIKLHFKGNVQDFRDIDLSIEAVSQFAKRVYGAARTIPPGRTVTYGQLAGMSGHPGAARAVGRVMSKNPIPLIIPCHRVLASGGEPGGFSAYGGLSVKTKMLALEGVSFENGDSILA